MFCSNCGKEIPNDSKFCSSCGVQINNIQVSPIRNINSLNVRQISFDTKTIIFLVISAVMLLSMLILPTISLMTSNYGSTPYATISFLGDNYMARSSLRDTINTLSRIAFILMLAATTATVIFRMTKRIKLSLISSCINAGVLLFYNVSITGTWLSEATSYHKHSIKFGAGNIFCVLCSIALIILSLLAFKKENQVGGV